MGDGSPSREAGRVPGQDVERVLQEMLDEGAVFAPGAMAMSWHAKEGGDGDGERVKVMVIQKKGDAR